MRLCQHLDPVAPEAAARVVRHLAHAPDRRKAGSLWTARDPPDHRPQLWDAYEIAAGAIFILRLWHCRENRSSEAEEW